MVLDRDGVPLTERDLSRRRRTCNSCGSALWQADNSGPRRYPLADYIKHRMAGFFDLLIGDEIHEHKSRGSAQGIAAGILADVCGRTLSLSAAPFQRRLREHALPPALPLQPADPHRVRALGRAPVGRALRLRRAHHRQARRQPRRGRAGQPETALPKGRPREARPRTGSAVPPHRPLNLSCGSPMSRPVCPPTPRRCWSRAWTQSPTPPASPSGRHTMRCSRPSGPHSRTRSRRAQGDCSPRTCRPCSPSPTGARVGRPYSTRRPGDVLAQVPPLSEDRLYPKEKALLDLVAAERMAGRRVLVYVTHTGTRDITGRNGRHPHPARVPRRGHEGRRRGARPEGGVGRRQGGRGSRCPESATPGWCRPAST